MQRHRANVKVKFVKVKQDVVDGVFAMMKNIYVCRKLISNMAVKVYFN